MIKLSAVIANRNEQKTLVRCIDSLRLVADEILMMDSFLDDPTKRVLQKSGVRVIEQYFKSPIQQKNFAIREAQFDYIIFLYADEYISPELSQSILMIKKNWTADAYMIRQLYTYSDKWIIVSELPCNRKIRLLNRRKGQWGGTHHDGKIIMNKETIVKPLKGDILHLAYENTHDALSKIQSYSDIFAKKYKGRRHATAFKTLVKASFAFFYNYIVRKRILEGFEGLMVSAAAGNYVFYKYAKLYELNRTEVSFEIKVRSVPSLKENTKAPLKAVNSY